MHLMQTAHFPIFRLASRDKKGLRFSRRRCNGTPLRTPFACGDNIGPEKVDISHSQNSAGCSSLRKFYRSLNFNAQGCLESSGAVKGYSIAQTYAYLRGFVSGNLYSALKNRNSRTCSNKQSFQAGAKLKRLWIFWARRLLCQVL